jgi:hypothetical protein
MQVYRWAILVILAGITAVLLGTAVYAYHLATPAERPVYRQSASASESDANIQHAINMTMEEGGLALITAARWLSQDWRRADFTVAPLRISRFSDMAGGIPGLQTQIAPSDSASNHTFPGPITTSTRPAFARAEAKASTLCPAMDLSRRIVWSRPWPTAPNPTTVCLCPDEGNLPLLASTP